jgi:hypothetical protein
MWVDIEYVGIWNCFAEKAAKNHQMVGYSVGKLGGFD